MMNINPLNIPENWVTAFQGLNIPLILIGGVFLVFGLLAGKLVRRSFNVILFVLLIWVGMTILERADIGQNWLLFDALRHHLLETGKSVVQLFSQLLDGAPILFSSLFLVGGLVSLFLGRQSI